MSIRRPGLAPALLALAAGLIALTGCNKKPNVPIVAGNQPPTVRITSAPRDTTQRNYYVITLNWIGNDPDGRVDRFLFAVDPPRDPGLDTVWTSTTENTLTRSFPSTLPDRQNPANSSDFHVFVIKAVDNRGMMSPPVARAFWSYTEAPRVQVRVPPANPLVRYYVPPALLVRWEGFDDDGVFTQKPVKYKFKLLTQASEVPLSLARSNPDSVRRYYAPRNWAGWDSLPGDTTEKQFTNLTPDQEYVFVVVAFDEAGAYSPIFSLNDNMIYFRVTFTGAQNPRIGFFNEFFLYEYVQGSYRPLDPAQVVRLEVPAGEPGNPNDKLTFNWYGLPATDSRGNQVGGPIRSYRWAVDIVDVFDNTERSDEETDLAHWSQKTSAVTSCRIGPYAGNETHKFYLEVEDINGLKSLGIIEFTAVQATFANPLLVVDDTRYLLDSVSPGQQCPRPIGNWPTAAELDTFLFARGGVPWYCYPAVGGQPQLSSPGLFSGYRFDTLGTNMRTQDLTVRLSRLGQYRHVIWLVDGAGALNNKPGTDAGDIAGPTTSLRYMNANRQANTLAAFVRQGGKVWLAGGGAPTASMINFNRGINDNSSPNPRTLTFRFTDNELLPGRFVYDQGHWRSEFKQFRVNGGRLRRYLGRYRDVPGGGGYSDFPAEIMIKSPATDPFPPNRTGSQAIFYQTQYDVEFLSAANEIIEDLDPGPNEDFQSTLDTLCKVTASTLQPDTGASALQSVVMTRYTGLENTEFIITGFNLWNFRRQHCKEVVDFVLQRIWEILPDATYTPPPVVASARRSGALSAAPVPAVPAVQAAPPRASPLRPSAPPLRKPSPAAGARE
jgi:hypothetical protein